ncbi:MAG: hypothetical protein ACOWWO_05035 [Peptococcaceae bacterium]
MEHPTHTRIIFAKDDGEAKEKYLQLQIKPDHDMNPRVDIHKVTEEEDFDVQSPFNLFGEVSVGPDVMELIKTNVDEAYVVYYLEKVS